MKNFRNFTQTSLDPLKNFRKKTLIINKLQKQALIPNLQNKTNELFQDPDNYLKLPYETDFHFVVGKKPKGPRFNSDNKIIPYSIVGTSLRKEYKKNTRRKSQVPTKTNFSSSSKLKKSLRLSKIKFNTQSINDASQKEENKKKNNYQENNISPTELFDIFNKSKKRINKNKIENLVQKSKLNKKIQTIMHQYIDKPLSLQEKVLKNNEQYNNIVKKIENNIFKILKNKKKNKNNYFNESRFFDGTIFNSSNLLKNSAMEYRKKVEKNNINDKIMNPPLILHNPIQNWEMSLRRPHNFKGERREYLNIRTDKNPYWIILTEKNPLEDEKITSPTYINNKHKDDYLKKFYNSSYFKPFIKPLNLTNNGENSSYINNLEIKGKKLIDVEEKLANQLKGNIKMIDLKYDRESIKDLLLKTNISINNHSLEQK